MNSARPCSAARIFSGCRWHPEAASPQGFAAWRYRSRRERRPALKAALRTTRLVAVFPASFDLVCIKFINRTEISGFQRAARSRSPDRGKAIACCRSAAGSAPACCAHKTCVTNAHQPADPHDVQFPYRLTADSRDLPSANTGLTLAMLEVRSLTKRYSAVTAVDDVSFTRCPARSRATWILMGPANRPRSR